MVRIMPLLSTPMMSNAEERAEDGALAALQGAAAEDRRGDRLELQALGARDRLARAGARGKKDARDPGEEAAHHVDADVVATDVMPEKRATIGLPPMA